MIRTDLAAEAAELYRESMPEAGEPDGVRSITYRREGYVVTKVDITTNDGAALIAAAQEAARRTAAEALRQAEAQADTERQAMLAHTEEDCQALREAALGRMDGAVAYLLEKVVKR